MVSAICEPMVKTGLSAAAGSWKTKPMRRPRTRRRLSASRSRRFRPSSLDAAGGDAAWRRNESDDRQRRHRLAAAGFADEAERLAAADRERHRVDRRGFASAVHGNTVRRPSTRRSGVPSAGCVTVLAKHAPHRVGDFAERRPRLDGRQHGRHEVRSIARRLFHAGDRARPGRTIARGPHRGDPAAACRRSPSGSIRRSSIVVGSPVANWLTPTTIASPRSIACWAR